MKKIILAVWLSATATMVYASCTSHQYFINGKLTTCTTCCQYGSCQTSCI